MTNEVSVRVHLAKRLSQNFTFQRAHPTGRIYLPDGIRRARTAMRDD